MTEPLRWFGHHTPRLYRLGVRLVRAVGSALTNALALAGIIAVVLLITVGGTFVTAWVLIHVHDWLSDDTPYRDQRVCWVQTEQGHPQLHEGPRREEPFSGVVEVGCP